MRPWTLELLCCLECGGALAPLEEDGISCRDCGAHFPTREDVTNFLSEPHPTVAREIEAVASLDGLTPETEARLRALIQALDQLEVRSPEDSRLNEFPSFREFFTTRRRAADMLESLELPARATIVELGADHCLSSSTLIDAGFRVVAVDITDHLLLAPRPDHPDLCRLKADMNRLPLLDRTVDVVWATACVHHSWSLERTFSEAHRVLKKQGVFVLLSEPMPTLVRYLMFGFGRRFGGEQRRLGINETLHRRSVWLATARRTGFEPTLRFPTLTLDELDTKFAHHRVPARIRPILARLSGLLQVSIHMVAVPG